MNITIEQQREYITKVAERAINNDLDKLAATYRIDAMVELVPSLKDFGSKAINRIYTTSPITQIR